MDVQKHEIEQQKTRLIVDPHPIAALEMNEPEKDRDDAEEFQIDNIQEEAVQEPAAPPPSSESAKEDEHQSGDFTGNFGTVQSEDSKLIPPPNIEESTPQTQNIDVTNMNIQQQSDLGEADTLQEEKLEPASEVEKVTFNRPCHCKNSRCIQLYCECFSNGRFCDNCQCTMCQNLPQFHDVVQLSVLRTLERNPMAFRPKTKKVIRIRGRAASMTGQSMTPMVVGQKQAEDGSRSASPIPSNLTPIASNQASTPTPMESDSQLQAPSTAQPQASVYTSLPRGCQCKRTNCLKGYCDCYQAGNWCSNLCRCTDCCNHPDLIDKAPQIPTITRSADDIPSTYLNEKLSQSNLMQRNLDHPVGSYANYSNSSKLNNNNVINRNSVNYNNNSTESLSRPSSAPAWLLGSRFPYLPGSRSSSPISNSPSPNSNEMVLKELSEIMKSTIAISDGGGNQPLLMLKQPRTISPLSERSPDPFLSSPTPRSSLSVSSYSGGHHPSNPSPLSSNSPASLSTISAISSYSSPRYRPLSNDSAPEEFAPTNDMYQTDMYKTQAAQHLQAPHKRNRDYADGDVQETQNSAFKKYVKNSSMNASPE